MDNDKLIQEIVDLLKIISPLAEGEYPVSWCYALTIRRLLDEAAKRGFQ